MLDTYGNARFVNHSSMDSCGVRKLVTKYLEANGDHLGGDVANMCFYVLVG